MRGLVQDLRFALRSFVTAPGFFLVAVLTLALGVGATTTIFSVVDTVVLRPLPYPDSDQLMVAGTTRTNRPGIRASSPMRYLWWKENQTAFTALFASRSAEAVLTERGPAQRVPVAGVTADYFDAMAVEPALGRRFAASEDAPEQPPVVVLSHQFWRRVFGGDADAIGDTLTLNQREFTIIGIMPESYHPPAAIWQDDVELWYPLTQGDVDLTSHAHFLQVAGRLRPGVTTGVAREELARINDAFNEQFPASIVRGADLASMRDTAVGPVGGNLFMLLGAVSLLLLIACANVANLLLTRANHRQRELSIRAALGAGRWRIVRQLLTESILLATTGGLAGALLADAGVKAFRVLCPVPIPRLDEVAVDGRVLAAALAASVATGLIFGLLPALRMVRREAGAAARSLTHHLTADRQRHRLQHLLVVGETVLALMLMLGAGLLINSFVRLQRVDPGFQPEGLVVMEVNLAGGAGYEEDDARRTFFNTLIERVEALPGVESVAAVHNLPLRPASSGTFYLLEGQSFDPAEADQRVVFHEVTPGYFDTLGVRLLQGRDFDATDRAGAETRFIVNESFARRNFPDGDVLGQRINVARHDDWSPIIGVVADIRQSALDTPGEPEIYYTMNQAPRPRMHLVVRSELDGDALAPALRAEVAALDASIPVSLLADMPEVIADSITTPRFYTLLLSIFATVALALALVGLYATMAYAVARRTREIGVRMALGSPPVLILRQVLGRGMRLTLFGIVLGIAGAIGATRVLSNFLYGIESTDIATFAFVATSLGVVAVLACYVPARRATRIDPLVALREE